jgi:hypothetical protein
MRIANTTLDPFIPKVEVAGSNPVSRSKRRCSNSVALTTSSKRLAVLDLGDRAVPDEQAVEDGPVVGAYERRQPMWQ